MHARLKTRIQGSYPLRLELIVDETFQNRAASRWMQEFKWDRQYIHHVFHIQTLY